MTALSALVLFTFDLRAPWSFDVDAAVSPLATSPSSMPTPAPLFVFAVSLLPLPLEFVSLRSRYSCGERTSLTKVLPSRMSFLM